MSNQVDLPVDLPAARSPGRYAVPLMSACLALLVLFLLGFAAGRVGLGTRIDSFRVFWEAWERVEHKFYALSPLDPLSMTRGALRGMLASLDDPYTVFVEPSQRQMERERLEGQFGGIGVSLGIMDQRVVIASVAAGAPADRAGLRIGDVLLAVDGTEVAGWSLEQVALSIRGDVGTSVQLRVRRDNEGDLVFSITREQIELPSLSWQLLEDNVAYVHIHQFTARTSAEFSHAVRSLATSDVHGLVLDLRDNGGGLVDSAVQVLGQLVGHGIAYREVSKDGEKRQAIPFEAEPIEWPLAVLVDGTSASAAELVAAALRDHDRALLFGETTYGKGSMQGIFPLSDGSSIHVTTARWLSPDGHPIQDGGVQPDVALDSGRDGVQTDLVLQGAIRYLRGERGG